MTTTLVHISDLHFGDPKGVLNRDDVGRVLKALLRKAGPGALVMLSGDISFKGGEGGYTEASAALSQVLDDEGVLRSQIVVCPGNHDVVMSATGSSPFSAFDAWSASLRSDKRCTFSDGSCRRVTFPEADFLVINTAYHADIEYGFVDLPKMESILAEMGPTPVPGQPRIALLHHHLIPFARDDHSTTRNAYAVLSVLVRHGFALVLHGHQHALLELLIGDGSLKICGVGSFRYVTPGFVNGASIYRFDEKDRVSTQHYALSKDAPEFLRALTNF
jgi:3',5'-cyclic AMP phosphodiesterase CpdA